MVGKRRRIGLFGGSFDPPHRAHLALACAALDALGLDELRWLPAGRAWQKAGAFAPPEARRAMLQRLLAEAPDPRHLLDFRELDRPGPSYTVDTLRELRQEQPEAELWLLIGEDQWRRLATWREPEDLLTLARLAVAPRPDGTGAPPPAWPPALHAAARPHWLPMALDPASSTRLRTALAAGASAASVLDDSGRPLLPAALARWIDSAGWYRASGRV